MKKDKPLIGVVEGWGVCRPLEIAGATTFSIDDAEDVKDAMPYLDGILFTGGSDLDPERYGVDPSDVNSEVYGINVARDELEFNTIREAMDRGLAIMGICRGSQLINVAHGGTLHQHLPHVNGGNDHWGTVHGVKLSKRSRLAKFLKKPYLSNVSSYHHQAVQHLGEGLMPIGWSHDGTIEAIETLRTTKHYALGLQFHPEMDYRTDKDAMTIFEHFVDACRGRTLSKMSGLDRYAALMEMAYNRMSINGKLGGKGHGGSSIVEYASDADRFLSKPSTVYSGDYAKLDKGGEYDWEGEYDYGWWDSERQEWIEPDSEAYDEWLRLNSNLYANEHTVQQEREAQQESCNAICAFPPCGHADLCDADERDCFSLRVADDTAARHSEDDAPKASSIITVDAALLEQHKRGNGRKKRGGTK